MKYRATIGGGALLVVLGGLGGASTLLAADATGHLPLETMAGQVLDPAGHPVSKATVWLVGGRYDEDAKVLDQAVSDDRGRFAFANLLAKYVRPQSRLPYLIARDAQGRIGGNNYPWEYPGQKPRRDVQIKLLAVRDYRGRLLDVAGRPIAKAHVQPLAVSPIGIRDEGYQWIDLLAKLSDELACTSGPDGTLVFRHIPGRSVNAKVTTSGFGALNVSWDLDRHVTIRLSPVGNVRGTLKAPPGAKSLDTLKLNIYRQGDSQETKNAEFRISYAVSALAGKDGSFRFDDVPPGLYRLDPELSESTLPFYGKEKTSFSVKSGGTATVEVALLPAVAVRGQVVDRQTRRGIAGCYVWASLVSEQGNMTLVRRAITGADGRFMLCTPPGKVSVQAAGLPQGYIVTGESRPGTMVTGDIAWPAIEIERTVSLEGIVVDESGRTVADAEVQSLCSLTGLSIQTQSADQNGAFVISDLNPKETLAIRAHTETAVSDVLQLRPSDAQRPVRLVISPSRAVAIRGTCVDSSGRPVPRAKAIVGSVWMLGNTGISCSVGSCETDLHGRFEIRNLWPGFPYHVSINAEGYDAFESPRFEAQPGEAHDYGKLVLAAVGGYVEGVVKDSSGRPIAGSGCSMWAMRRRQSARRAMRPADSASRASASVRSMCSRKKTATA